MLDLRSHESPKLGGLERLTSDEVKCWWEQQQKKPVNPNHILIKLKGNLKINLAAANTHDAADLLLLVYKCDLLRRSGSCGNLTKVLIFVLFDGFICVSL